ncbi:hypothetical protein ACMD2_13988 [Ananas comosus]|uniref:AB hydrolase-1 domain-containing protein n=1 Tax=Ananas comosus TaxID=4615 RepID=A0A199V0M5_ANACO|nr:hypothetical protein ACMD2_13988 [Ananas comosus]
MLLHLHSRDLRTAVAAAAVAGASKPPWSGGGGGGGRRSSCRPFSARADPPFPRPLTASSPKTSAAAASPETAAVKVETKPPVCTADELHYAPVPGTEWRLALWRYMPSPEAPKRNHPLMLLSGVGTNAIGFDLSPGASFARHMASQGFDTWIVEVRGAGLSMRASESNKLGRSDSDATCKDSSNGVVERQSTLESVQAQNSDTLIVNGNKPETATWDEPQLVTKLTATFMRLAETLSGYLNEGQSRVISAKFFDRISKLLEDARLNQRLNEIAEKISGLLEARAQNSTVANQIRDLSQRLVKTIEEGQRTVSPQLFDLQERFSATIEDFQKQLDLIVTYDWDFDNYLEEDIPAAANVEFLYQADPAQALNVPVVPLGALLAAAHPLSSRPPFVLSWLNPQISAQDMMHPELFSKLVLNNFCTVPAKVLLQLTTAFREGGLCNRTATFYYKNHLQNCSVPVLALAGDQDLICPPEAVYETVKLLPQQMVTYKVFGKPDGPHYAHYDLVGGRLALNEVYPCIIGFLSQHDKRQSQ